MKSASVRNIAALFFLGSVTPLLTKNGLKGIIGARKSMSWASPSAVAIKSGDTYICSGAILDLWHIITAAHCIIDIKNPSPLTVTGGTRDLNTFPNERFDIPVIRAYIPIEYLTPITNYTIRVGDIAVLKLEKSLAEYSLSLHIGKVKLPGKKYLYTNKTGVVVGYGWNKIDKFEWNEELQDYEETGSSDGKKRYAAAKIVKQSKCQDYYPEITTKSLFCAAVLQKREDKPSGICTGDSGGPLLVNSRTLIGIVNESPDECDETKGPGIYARVSQWLGFIRKARHGISSPKIITVYIPLIAGYSYQV